MLKIKSLFTLTILPLLLSCGTNGALLPNSATGSSLDMPINTVETWQVTSADGNKSEVSTVKTEARAFRFNGRFPSSFFGQPVEVPVAGTITYQSDGTAVLRYSAPLPATVKAIYDIRNGGEEIVLTTTDSEPAWAKIGEKTTLLRQSVTTPEN